jgi:hypothetical protein
MYLGYLNKIDRAKRYHKFSLLIFQYSIWFWLCQVRHYMLEFLKIRGYIG